MSYNVSSFLEMIGQKSYIGKEISRHRWEDTIKVDLKEGGWKGVESPDSRSVAGPSVVKCMEFADYLSGYYFLTNSHSKEEIRTAEGLPQFLWLK